MDVLVCSRIFSSVMKINRKNEKSRLFCIVAAFIILLFAVSLAASVYILNRSDSNRVAYIYSNGTLVEKIYLDRVDESYTIRIDNGDGYNIVFVDTGKIGVCEASCPDKVCVRTGSISSSALPVACLPNKLIIKISSEDKADIIVG